MRIQSELLKYYNFHYITMVIFKCGFLKLGLMWGQSGDIGSELSTQIMTNMA